MSWRALALVLLLSAGGCASLTPAQRARTEAIVQAARSDAIDCAAPDACAQPSSLYDLGPQALAQSTPQGPRHYALILDYGQDALLARINLIRSARRSIDLQTYIFDEDEAGRLVIEELLAAARRGVRVRVLIDQLSALKRVQTLAALAGTHRNFELRLYHPVLNRARINYAQYVLAAACCWRKLNQRMHSKLLLVDGEIGITGGRNYQDDYYDWDDQYDFRDRDVLVAGPEVGRMQAMYDAFWDDRRSVPVEALHDVGHLLLRHGVPPLDWPQPVYTQRMREMARDAGDATLVREHLTDAALPVGKVDYVADTPRKHRREGLVEGIASRDLQALVESARRQVLLQTPYLVLSKPAQRMFRALHERADPPDVVISTNSLASIDSFITYALTYKYRRRYMRDFGFQIHEFKPFPGDAPIDLDASGKVDIAWDAQGNPLLGTQPSQADPRKKPPLAREYSALRYAGFSVNKQVPLKRAGLRIGLHAKSMVIDDHIGVIGTHNFDPRSDAYNTEGAVVIDDPAFARALAASIARDIAPENSWTIARRPKSAIFPGLEYSLAKVSEKMPIFDFWPVRYATSYDFRPGPDCPHPLPPKAPGFGRCYEPVGDFPEVNVGIKSLLTRIFTAFGAGLAPIL